MDAKTAKKNERRDLERLALNVAKVERIRQYFAAEGDKEMVQAMAKDVRDLQALAAAVKAGKYRRAAGIAYRVDTAVRDLIPARLYNAINR